MLMVKIVPIICALQLVTVLLTKANEIVFDAPANGQLDKALSNLLLADQLYRDNVKQGQLLLECNQKLAMLEAELSRTYPGPSSASLLNKPVFDTDTFNDSMPIAGLVKSLKVQLIDYFK